MKQHSHGKLCLVLPCYYIHYGGQWSFVHSSEVILCLAYHAPVQDHCYL